jgi:pyruvate dehydrogenase E1 component
MGLFRHRDGRWFDEAESEAVMTRLRSFSARRQAGVPELPRRGDPDGWHFLPSGSVGIPPVAAVYLALAYRYARQHGWDVDEPHFWCMMGDSEFREGSLLEVLPEVAERELGNVTWIVDYNRQNLDGTRIPNNRGLQGTDADRIEGTAVANGWEVIQLRHGRSASRCSRRKGGDALRKVFERGFTDYHYQALLWKRDAKLMREAMLSPRTSRCKALLESLSDADMVRLFFDTGGHDVAAIVEAFEQSKQDKRRPTLIIAHTIKGRGLQCVAANGNHSAMPEEDEVDAILKAHGLSLDARSGASRQQRGASSCTQRGLRDAPRHRSPRGAARRQPPASPPRSRRRRHAGVARHQPEDGADHPHAVDVGPAGREARPHRRLRRTRQGRQGAEGRQGADADEARWNPLADLMMTMAPDVGTSTNINPAMDEKIFGPKTTRTGREAGRPARAPAPRAGADRRGLDAPHPLRDRRGQLHVGGRQLRQDGTRGHPVPAGDDGLRLLHQARARPALLQPLLEQLVRAGRHAERHHARARGRAAQLEERHPDPQPDHLGAGVRDRDGVDPVRRDPPPLRGDNKGRSGVLIRAVTRALHQHQLLDWLKKQARGSARCRPAPNSASPPRTAACTKRKCRTPPTPRSSRALKHDVLAGGYRLIDWRGYRGYQPGENVVELFVMGALVPEAIEASQLLLDRGVYANVTVVTSPDLLCGELARKTGYQHLRQTLGVTGRLHLRPAGKGAARAARAPAT